MEPTVSKTLRYLSISKITKVDSEDGNGYIEGYASTYDDPDLVNETFAKGAYHKTIIERVNAGKVQLMDEHFAYGGGSRNVVGTVTEAKEDEHGLWIHAEFASTQDAQDIRKKAQEGHLNYLSVGFVPVKWEYDEKTEVLTFTEVKLQEVTITNLPCNESCALTDAKSTYMGRSRDEIAEALALLDAKTAASQSIDDEPEHSDESDAASLVEQEVAKTQMLSKKFKLLF